MKIKVIKTIEKYNMFSNNESVAVALSGGADSVALLLVLREIFLLENYTLTAIHINHNLRGEESLRDENFCKSLCEKYKIPLIIQSVDVISYCKEHKLSIEEGARQLRYKAFSACKADKLATAHTLSDTMETVLFNLTRGTGLEGLTGIPPIRGNIVRPLSDVTRNEVETFLSQKRQDFIIDSSNEDNYYSRNKIRNTVIPILKTINPGLEATIKRTINTFASDEDYLATMANNALLSLKDSDDAINYPGLIALPCAISTRVIKLFLEEHSMSYDNKTINAILTLEQAGGTYNLTTDKSVIVSQQRLFLRHTKPTKNISIEVSIPTSQPITLDFDDKKVTLTPVIIDNSEKNLKILTKEFENLIDCDTIKSMLLIRSKKDGDKYPPLRRNCTKTLKNLMNEKKIPVNERSTVPILASDDEIYWVEGFGVSEKHKISPKTKKAVLIKILREDL